VVVTPADDGPGENALILGLAPLRVLA